MSGKKHKQLRKEIKKKYKNPTLREIIYKEAKKVMNGR